jgi:putative hydrolase of the HAD superfamily
VRAVILDFYGTLAETPDWGPSWAELVASVGYELPDDVRDRWWRDGLDGTEHDEHSQSRDHYVAWQHGRIRGMLDDCGIPRATQDDLIARVREVGAHRRMRAYDEVPGVLAELRARGLTLAICSNWDWDLLEAIDAAGLADTVDVIVSSAWVGARKPHPRMYDAVLAKVGVEPADALFVGDTWTCDVDGPRIAGLRAMYLRRSHFGPDATAPADHHTQTVHRADDLRAVLAVLDEVSSLRVRARPSTARGGPSSTP